MDRPSMRQTSLEAAESNYRGNPHGLGEWGFCRTLDLTNAQLERYRVCHCHQVRSGLWPT